MKNGIIATVIAVILLTAFAAFAIAERRVDRFAEVNPAVFVKGYYVGPDVGLGKVQADTKNKVTRVYGAQETFTFTSQTITSQDSTGVTVTGARLGDVCNVGATTALAANVDFTCYVSAADTVKGRFNPSGTAAAPGATTLNYIVFSNQ